MPSLILLSVCLIAPVFGQGIDRYGDPLPKGAIARLGTIRLRHEANSITGVVVSPDSKLIATATNNSPHVFVFDVATGERVAVFGPEDPNASLYWNGPSLAFEGDSQSLLIMNLLSGQVERLHIDSGKREPLGKPTFVPHPTRASANGQFVACVSPEGAIHIFEYANLKEVAVLKLDSGAEIHSLSFDLAGELLALGDRKRKKFEVWNVAEQKVVWSADGDGYNYHIAISPSGKAVAYTPASSGFVVQLIGQDEPLLAQDKGGSTKMLAFSPDEKTVVAAKGSSFEFWNIDTQKMQRKVDLGFGGFAVYSPDGKTTALTKSSHAVRLFDAESGDEHPKFETHYDDIKGIAANRDGTRVLTRAWNDTIKVWDVEQQKPLLSVNIRPISPKGMVITPDGKRIAYARNGLQLFDVTTGEQTHKLPIRSGEAMAISPDGKRVAVADELETSPGVSFVDIATGEKTKFLKTDKRIVASCWLPDGKHLVTAENAGNIGLWSIESGELVREFKRLAEGGVKSLAVHPNGKVLASTEGGFEAKVRFYRIETGEPIEVELEDYDAERGASAQEVAFTGDGKYVVARIDFRLYIWDLKTRKRVLHLGSQADYISAFALSGDGRRLVTCSALDHLLVWQLDRLLAE